MNNELQSNHVKDVEKGKKRISDRFIGGLIGFVGASIGGIVVIFFETTPINLMIGAIIAGLSGLLIAWLTARINNTSGIDSPA